ncbi:MAG: NblA/ycf18 family protein [Thermosynechococcaceae cyanobacterium MS004]|nr:NblA/ycf18 family protein [Thermosynechococcaceae cyanobacterium MS004]
MDIRHQLPLEQQFELRVFEGQVRQLSQEEAHELLIQLREEMLYQTTAFREILKEAWGIDKNVDVTLNLLANG